MGNENILASEEESVLAALGYLVMRWNYAEHFARQILRRYLAGESIFEKEHVKLTKLPAVEIEKRLANEVLPRWQRPGRSFLEHLICAYSVGREHRNRIVHGIYLTTPTRGERPAQAVLISWRPEHENLPPFVDLETMQKTAHHFHDLAMFARAVSLSFGGDGSIARDKDGSPVMIDLPNMIEVLPAL